MANQGDDFSLVARREVAHLDQDLLCDPSEQSPPSDWDGIPRWRTSRPRPSLMFAYDHERRRETMETESSTAGVIDQSSFPPRRGMFVYDQPGTQDVRERQLEALESSYNHPIAPPIRRGRWDPFHDGRYMTSIGLSIAGQQRPSPSRYMTDYGDEIDRGFGDSDDEDMRRDRRLAIELALHGSDESGSDDDYLLLDEDEAEANAVTDSLTHTSPPSSLNPSSGPTSTLASEAHSPVQELEVATSQQREFKSERQLPTGEPKDCDDSTQLKTSGDEKSSISCVICLEKPSQESIASIDGCEHQFCFECIAQWAEHENSCPLCKNRFAKIVRLQPSKKRKVGDEESTQNTKRVKHKDQRSDLQASLDNVAGMFGKSRPPFPAAFIPVSHNHTQRVCEAAGGGHLLPGLFCFPHPPFRGIHQSLFDSPWRLHVPKPENPPANDAKSRHYTADAPSMKSSVALTSVIDMSCLREGLRLDRSLDLPIPVRGEEGNYHQNLCLKTTTTTRRMNWRKISSCLLRRISNDFIVNWRVEAQQQTVAGLSTTQRTQLQYQRAAVSKWRDCASPRLTRGLERGILWLVQLLLVVEAYIPLRHRHLQRQVDLPDPVDRLHLDRARTRTCELQTRLYLKCTFTTIR